MAQEPKTPRAHDGSNKHKRWTVNFGKFTLGGDDESDQKDKGPRENRSPRDEGKDGKPGKEGVPKLDLSKNNAKSDGGGSVGWNVTSPRERQDSSRTLSNRLKRRTLKLTANDVKSIFDSKKESDGDGKLSDRDGKGKATNEVQPGPEELNRRFEEFLSEMGYTQQQKLQFKSFTPQQKWTLLSQSNKASQAHRKSPQDYLAMLKKPDVRIDHVANLAISLKGEKMDWIVKFIEIGGPAALNDLLKARVIKRHISIDEHNVIINVVHSFKALMSCDIDLSCVVEVPGFAEMLLLSLEVMSNEKALISAFEMLAVCVTLDVGIHKMVITKSPGMAYPYLHHAGSSNMELVYATFLFLNALFSHKLERKDKEVINRIRENLLQMGLGRLLLALRKRDDLKGKLLQQLDIFEDRLENGLSAYVDVLSENPEDMFKKLLLQVKGTPVFDAFVSIFKNLNLLRTSGKLGYVTWEIIDKYIHAANTLAEVDTETLQTAASVIYKKLMTDLKEHENALEKLDLHSPRGNAPEMKRSINDPQAKEGEEGAAGADGDPDNLPMKRGGARGARGARGRGDRGEAGGEGADGEAGGEGGGEGRMPRGPRGPRAPRGRGDRGARGDRGGRGGPRGGEPEPQKAPLKPSVKMKQLNWTKINGRKIDGTIWKAVDDTRVELPKEMLEELFGAAVIEEKVEKKVTKEVILLDPKRWQNLSIMLSRFSDLPMEKLANAIKELNEEVINLDNLKGLRQFIPTPDEMAMIKDNIMEPGQQLGKPERYFLEIMKIPNFEQKMNIWTVMRTFESLYYDCEKQINFVMNACNEVRNSRQLEKLFEVALAFGNYINGSTPRGAAWGFTLSSVLKLGDVRASRAEKGTLVNFIANWIQNKDPEMLVVKDKFVNVENAKRYKMSYIQADVTEIKTGVTTGKNYLEKSTDNDLFKKTLASFLPGAESKLTGLNELFQKTQEKLSAVVVYFGEDAKMESDAFFTVISEVVALFERAKVENERRRELEEKARRKKELADSKKDEPVNAMNKVLKGLVTGDAYTEDQETRKFGAREMTKRASVTKDPAKDTLDIDQAIKSLKKVSVAREGNVSPRGEAMKGQPGPNGVVLRSATGSAGGRPNEKEKDGEEGERMFKLRPTAGGVSTGRGGALRDSNGASGASTVSPPRSPRSPNANAINSNPREGGAPKPLPSTPKVTVEEKAKKGGKDSEKLSKSSSKGDKKGKDKLLSSNKAGDLTRSKSRDDLKGAKRKEVKKSSKDTVISPRVAGEKKDKGRDKVSSTSPKREKASRSDSKKQLQPAAQQFTQSAGPTLTTPSTTQASATSSPEPASVARQTKSDTTLLQSTTAAISPAHSLEPSTAPFHQLAPFETGNNNKSKSEEDNEPPPMRLPPTQPPKALGESTGTAQEIGLAGHGLKEINASAPVMETATSDENSGNLPVRKISRSLDHLKPNVAASYPTSPLSQSQDVAADLSTPDWSDQRRAGAQTPTIQISASQDQSQQAQTDSFSGAKSPVTMVRSDSFEANEAEDGSGSSRSSPHHHTEAKSAADGGDRPDGSSSSDEARDVEEDSRSSTSDSRSRDRSVSEGLEVSHGPSQAGSPTASTGGRSYQEPSEGGFDEFDEKAYREQGLHVPLDGKLSRDSDISDSGEVGDSEEDIDRLEGAKVDTLGRTLQKGEVTRKEAYTIVEGIKETLKEIVEGIYSKLSASEQESETESTVDAKGLTHILAKMKVLRFLGIALGKVDSRHNWHNEVQHKIGGLIENIIEISIEVIKAESSPVKQPDFTYDEHFNSILRDSKEIVSLLALVTFDFPDEDDTPFEIISDDM